MPTTPTQTVTYSCSLVTQGKHKFYTLTMPSEILAATCVVDTRAANPVKGFQRMLDERRAEEIAAYVDQGWTIPTSIILSAQADSALRYTNTRRSITFNVTPRSFLILDGQHRVYGFMKAKTKLRVPVVIYNELTREQECRLFIDINTKQRPVPNELLLGIKHLADIETDSEALFREVFDLFREDPKSPLLGMMSDIDRARGKISRVTFYAAIKGVRSSFSESRDGQKVYDVLQAYLHAWCSLLRGVDLQDRIANPTIFRAVMMLFPDVAQRVQDKTGASFTADHFLDVLSPMFKSLPKAKFSSPPKGISELYEYFKANMKRQISI